MDLVMVANAWSAGLDNPTSKHRIARELARRGHRVLWVEGAGMRRPQLGSGADRRKILGKVQRAFRGAVAVEEGIWVLAPLFLPLPRSRCVRFVNGLLGAAAARRWCRTLHFDRPVLVNYVPVLSEIMKRWAGPVVYHCVDRWDAFKMYDASLMAETDARCCKYAGTVIASSRALLEHCRELNERTYLVTHGVDREHFGRALEGPTRPADLPGGQVIGFFGLVSEWMDQELVRSLAEQSPEVQVVLIGTADVPTDRLEGLPNLHLLGPRPFSDLPDYVAHFAVGIIPFLVNDLTRAVNPIKLREMLAAGCPVVSTALPEVEVLGDCATVTRDRAHFLQAVREALAEPLDAAGRKALHEAMATETWQAKVDEIVALVEQHAVPPGPGGRT